MCSFITKIEAPNVYENEKKKIEAPKKLKALEKVALGKMRKLIREANSALSCCVYENQTGNYYA